MIEVYLWRSSSEETNEYIGILDVDACRIAFYVMSNVCHTNACVDGLVRALSVEEDDRRDHLGAV